MYNDYSTIIENQPEESPFIGSYVTISDNVAEREMNDLWNYQLFHGDQKYDEGKISLQISYERILACAFPNTSHFFSGNISDEVMTEIIKGTGKKPYSLGGSPSVYASLSLRDPSSEFPFQPGFQVNRYFFPVPLSGKVYKISPVWISECLVWFRDATVLPWCKRCCSYLKPPSFSV
ncbi:hypothetical protein CEXT_313261 [Caerostris extrusa]|uniref:Uncharacterized protein n=1 Tax=Caerostris extrusa TaxID=172846 RepID=A0AAV4QJ64_CAEEX|nr:hypothetical protein CEXT_313261 [Caerostris extrusa]